MKWLQRCKEKEIKEADRNTRYYHAKANGRRSKNKIISLEQDEGFIEGDQNFKKYITDQFNGRRNTPLHCSSNKNKTSSIDIFHPIAQVTLPYNPKSIQNVTTQSKCKEACLGFCSCTAYSYNNNICSVWHGELLSVNLNDGIESTSEDVLYLRLGANDLPSLSPKKRKPNVGVVTAASIISFGLIMLMMLLVIQRNKFKWCCLPLYNNQGCGEIIAFRYTDLVHATKNFSEKLGGGGFGSVYKGVLSGLTPIVVKRLDGGRQGEKQFRAEVSSLGLIQHIILVKLIGFWCEGDNRLLVYEHMLNGSLDGHLFRSNSGLLSCSSRYQIALGVARGLSYLHLSCHKCIIHCDIKPENILLDASFAPKVADFGLAVFLGRNFSRILTTFRDTVGYLPQSGLVELLLHQKLMFIALAWYCWKSYLEGEIQLKNTLAAVIMLNISLYKSSTSFTEGMWGVWWIHNYMVTSIQNKLKGFAKLHVGASKIMSLIGRLWVKWYGFLRVYRRLICPRCQDYLQL